jgi:hypothetical protein
LEKSIITAEAPKPPRAVNVKNYLKWGNDDREPQRLHELVRASGTATVCVATKAKFIEGNGFKDAEFYKAVINEKGQTVDALLRLVSLDLAEPEGFELLLNFNALGEVVEVMHMPFAQWRPGTPTDKGEVQVVFQKHTPVAGKKTPSKPTARLVYDANEPNEERAARMLSWPGGFGAYPGEVAYFFHQRPGEGGYHPEPVFTSVLVDIEVDGLLKISRRTDVRSGYSDKTMITEYGEANPTDEVKIANGTKYGQFVGPTGGRVLLQYAASKELKPDVDTFQAPDASERYLTDAEALKKSIRAVFQIPDICYGEATAGKLGPSQEFDDATKFVQNMVVNTDQRAIETVFAAVFKNFRTHDGEPICPTGDFSIQNLSLNPLPNAAEQESPEAKQAQKTLEAFNLLGPLVTNKILESMSQEQILALVGLKPAATTDPANGDAAV